MADSSKNAIAVPVGSGSLNSSLNSLITNAYAGAEEFKQLAEKVAALQKHIERIELRTGYVINEMEP